MAQKVVGFIAANSGRKGNSCTTGWSCTWTARCKHHGIHKGFQREGTKNDIGLIIPVVITVYADRSFTFVTKTPPAAVLIKKACKIESGSGTPNKTKVATITKRAGSEKLLNRKCPTLMLQTLSLQ